MDFNEMREKYKRDLLEYQAKRLYIKNNLEAQPVMAESLTQITPTLPAPTESTTTPTQPPVPIPQNPIPQTIPQLPINPINPKPPVAINTPEYKLPTNYGDNFIKDDFSKYTDTGYIRVRAFAADQAIPVANARVTISKYKGDEPLVFIETITDVSGNTPVIAVPAPPAALSQNPNNEIIPYGVYNIVIAFEKFKSVPIYNVPVFAGIISIQPVEVDLLLFENGGSPVINEDFNYNL